MFRYNFIYELKLLLRSRWIQLLSILLLLLFGFSTINGKSKVVKREVDISVAKQEVEETDKAMLKLLDSVEQGLEVSVPSWTIPSSPMAVGNYHPRVAAMDPQPMAFISTGQADLFTHYIKPTVSGDDFALNFTEMTSPVQLLFGSFDLAFVIVYLLPLLIIAFTYNVLSSEKEQGSLRLLASQPISLRKWVFQKLMLRFFWLSLLVTLSLVVVILVAGVQPLQWSGILILLGLALCYMLFWFALAFLVNIFVDSSAKNAVSLIMLWVVFVLLMPSVLNQVGNTLYPIPSRTLMINEMREHKAEATKRQDEILDNFLRDHPEYAINDSTQSRNFYHRYMASQKVVKEELKPIVDAYETQLQKQQSWAQKLQWISPTIVVQESLSQLAGTSTADYGNYRKQVMAFAGQWRAYLTTFLYNNTPFSQKDYLSLPQFNYQAAKSNSVFTSMLVLLLIAILLIGFGFAVQGKTQQKGILSN
ncbi:DUF3526 domain-containing protein [Muricauda sp. 334s03]|uniref:DUF3526 domain-containing protein n=1 Tax=Flagellimonas yonaguniensis TaxID=3031325 RepID=A0ABT5Y200_9FLAO|nr:DUF3526 domain-containing protein [[Muricauda] yonaguniensis]MDF0717473.1 DUF3526 domain-containing protein [[Muricauda] yonaguniensis]